MSKYDDLWLGAIQYGILQQKGELVKFMEFLENEIKPRNFIEIGLCEGATFYCWSKLTDGIKIGIDYPVYTWNGKDVTYQQVEQRKRNILNFEPTAHVIIGDSKTNEVIDEVGKILNGTLVDFLFIDGDHEYAGVKSDYENYTKYVRSGGVIVFHDIQKCPNQGEVNRFWEEVKVGKNTLTFIERNDMMGIGVIIKE